MAIPYVFVPPRLFAELLQCLQLPPDIFAQLLRMCGMALPIIRLPPEIFAQIISYLPSNSLKCLRLTCKAFEPWATPPLFKELVITSRYADLEIADRIIDRFAPVIRNIRIFLQPVYDRVHLDDYFHYAVSYSSHTKKYTPFLRCKPHSEQFLRIWKRLKDESLELETSTTITDILCRAFESTPRIIRVTLTSVPCQPVPISDDQCWCSQAATGAQKRTLDPWAPHTDLLYWPNEQYTSCYRPKPLHEAWVRLMQALKKSRKTVQEIVTEPANHRDGVLTNVFGERLGYWQTTSNTFASLTRLEIALNMGDGHLLTRYELVEANVAKMLSTAINLVHLHVDCMKHFSTLAIDDCVPPRTHFHAILEGCSPPRLKTLRLEGVSAKPEQLLRFFRSHHCLIDVAFHNFRLGGDTWEYMLQEIRNMTWLKVLKLDFLEFVAVPSMVGYNHRACEWYLSYKTFAREDGSSLVMYGR